MAPWIPQNIQKRLLRYVLQQLSLFSEIDLPNVDVSLGTQSQISLRDLQLDPDKVSIPGMSMRGGLVKELELRLTVTDGISIDASGVEIILAPTVNSTAKETGFSLAQSRNDLASSVMVGFADEGTSEESSEEEAKDSGAALSGVMARAAEMALARILVKISDVRLRIISDQATVDVVAAKVAFLVEEGVRNVLVEGVECIMVKPEVHPGTYQNAESEGNTSDSGSDSDFDEDAMSGSMTAEDGRKSLFQSAYFSHEEASSLYMSANSNVLGPKKDGPEKPAVRLLHVNTATISFKGLSDIEDLDVCIDSIKVAATPFPEAVAEILGSLTRLKKLNAVLQRKAMGVRGSKSQEEEADTEEDPVSPFRGLSVEQVAMSFTSALLANGQFFDPAALCLNLSGLEVTQKNSDLLFGGAAKIAILNGCGTVMQFCSESTEPKKDMLFEILKNPTTKQQEITVLLPKRVELRLDSDSLTPFLELNHKLGPVLDVYTRFSAAAGTSTAPGAKPKVIFQSSLVDIQLALNPAHILHLKVLPVSYNSVDGIASIKKLYVSDTAQANDEILTLTAIQYHVFPEARRIKSLEKSRQNGHLTTTCKLSIDGINFLHDFEKLKVIREAWSVFVQTLPKFPSPSPKPASPLKSSRIGGSVYFQTVRKALSLYIEIKQISVNFSQVAENFGNLNAVTHEVSAHLYNTGEWNVFVMGGVVSRSHGKTRETVLEKAIQEDRSSPIIAVKSPDPSIITVTLSNLLLEYYANWIQLLGADSQGSSTVENGVSEVDGNDAKANPPQIRVVLVDCITGLNPGRLKAKGLLVIQKGTVDVAMGAEIKVKTSIKSASLLLIDNAANVLSPHECKSKRLFNVSGENPALTWSHTSWYCLRGFVSVGEVASLQVDVVVNDAKSLRSTAKRVLALVEVKIHSNTWKLELCPDSSQTLTLIITDLKQPVVFRDEEKYLRQAPEGTDVFQDVDESAFCYNASKISLPSSSSNSLNMVNSFYNSQMEGNSRDNSLVSDGTETQSSRDRLSLHLDFDEDHFSNEPEAQERVTSQDESSSAICPMKLYFDATSVSIGLYDGFDWKETRQTVGNAIKRIETKALEENRKRGGSKTPTSERSRRSSHDKGYVNLNSEYVGDDYNVIGETIYDSIHVSFPIGKDPAELITGINKTVMEEEATPQGEISIGKYARKLRLRRSKFQKIQLIATGVHAEVNVLASDDPSVRETLDIRRDMDDDDSQIMTSIDVRVDNFEIIDNVPTSTWNKFLSYMRDAGDREEGISMLHVAIDMVKPIRELATVELVLTVKVLPVRLYVDQDTLDFLTRFGEFKDSRFLLESPDDEILYIRKTVVDAVKLKLDYKPKKIDYMSLRSGRTSEFVNFFILDESSMTLRRVVLFGVAGIPKLVELLKAIWTPDVCANQLPGVLAGLAPVKSIVKIGAGFKDLVAVPIKEYRKDKRLVRSLQKGAMSFAKTTGSELLKFGVKVAAGTQAILENAEEAMGGDGAASRLNSPHRAIDDLDDSEEPSSPDKRNNEMNSSQLIGRSSLSNSFMDPFAQRSMYRSRLQTYNEEGEDIDEDAFMATSHKSKASNADFLDIQHRYNVGETEYDEEEEDNESQKVISLYAQQPVDVKEGFQDAYRSLGHNLDVARKAIVNAGAEAADVGSAQGTAAALARAAPVALLRPMIGATEAFSRALMGATNQLDPEERLRLQEKYKLLLTGRLF
ncbi:hypothetical protein BABINDRAFT_163427 [Babjeviella inositovora NRRL Y-12698]|uniref:Autophagy-related protein 2 n=1 Tax=Babjeviella inositovora NRRL Y-12698 TaxID=984486 RepID=A0A1E3QKV6_9ASCO|nr:uncharacterized protein BABINDRAFT_163427 [Babjeviella inositovora NRRL Y-12698]ODQ77722.1 hypothetical protein BABINDRAFT_163427 [Babjeviella inositovora NRRL Y-12698]